MPCSLKVRVLIRPVSELFQLYTPSRQLHPSADTRGLRTNPSEQSPMVSALSLTKLQLPVSVRHSTSLCQLFCVFLENFSLFKNLFFSPIAIFHSGSRAFNVCSKSSGSPGTNIRREMNTHDAEMKRDVGLWV